MLTVSVRPKAIAVLLAYSIVLLALAHLVVSTLEVYWPSMFGLNRLFNLGIEGNLPTFYSAIQLLVAGILLAVIALDAYRHQDRRWWGWMLLACGFLMMSVDEAAQVHEGVIGKLVVRAIGEGEGIWFYAWYAAYIPVLAALLLIYVPFLRSLPRRYLRLFVGAGFLFIGGAIGVEMVESYLAFNEMDGMILTISLLVEESCELAGVALFIYALLCYIGENRLVVRLSVQTQNPDRQVMLQPPNEVIRDARESVGASNLG